MQSQHSRSARSVTFNIRRFYSSDEYHLLPCTSHGNVQTPFSTSLVQRSKIQRHLTLLITTIAHAKNHYVPFVALNILKVLHEETFQPVFLEEMLKFRLFPQVAFNRFLHSLHLSYTERNDSESFLWIILEMFKNQACDGFCFHRVISQSATVINGVFNVD